VPRGISGIIDVALSKEPKDRFHTISEMMAALDKWERAGDVIRTGPGRALSIDHELIAIQDLMQVIGQSAAVETKLRSLVERFPREVRAHRALGEHYNQCRRLADAAAAFQRGLTLDSENVDLNWDLGLTLLNLKQTDDAAAAIRRALPKLDSKRQAMAKALLRGRGERP
jgi:predicted Zn-dependent protease